MKYLDVNDFDDKFAANKINIDFLKVMAQDVDDFFKDFNDDPTRLSMWTHHYFCREDGGLLSFDYNEPHKHVCSVCGNTYINDELFDGAWVTKYRNLGATNAWKSALIYRLTNDKKYLNYVVDFANFYTENYSLFELHNKFGVVDDSKGEREWGCARIMPQSLNESIFIIRLINALELIKSELSKTFLSNIENKFFYVAFQDIKSQINEIHNIQCWFNSAIAIMGLFLGNSDMVDFAYMNEFAINRQLEEGITEDGFWYEGSIHYNFFLLEGIINQLIFSRVYSCDYALGEQLVKKMLVSAYHFAFDNHVFPNPNDGWPNINLKTYSYIYAMAVKVYGKESEIADMLTCILNKEGERGTLPLSKPYYYNNDISLEEFLFAQGVRDRKVNLKQIGSYNYPTSCYAMVKNSNVNVFVKYGHNGSSHAHFDKMNIEVMLKNHIFTRDLSNPGYGHPYYEKWHKISASHNTVLVDGKSHDDISNSGRTVEFDNSSIIVKCSEVYPGVDYGRSIKINNNGYLDKFEVVSKDLHEYDYIFHVQGELLSDVEMKEGNLSYKENGYEYITDVKEVVSIESKIELKWAVGELKVKSTIDLVGKKLYIAKTPGNPVNETRTAIILRSLDRNTIYNLEWNFEE